MTKIKSLIVVALSTALCGLLVFSSLISAMTFDNSGRSKRDLKRDKTAKPVQIIEFSGIGKGMVIADVFGGGGYFTEFLSQVVGDKGKVYLHNNQAYMKFVQKELATRFKDGRLANVVDYRKEANAMGFEKNSLDAVYFVLGYHDMYHKSDDWSVDAKKLLKQLHSALKPGGVMLVIDHAAPDGTGKKHSQKLHRIDEQYVKDELKDLGFTFVKAGQMLRNARDSRKISPFRPEIRRKTDRFVHLYKKG